MTTKAPFTVTTSRSGSARQSLTDLEDSLAAHTDGVYNVLSQAAGDGATSDTAALQARFNAAIASNRGYTVDIPARDYIVDDTIVIDSVAGLRVRGRGNWRTRFFWRGPSDRPMFLLRDVRDSHFLDFWIIGSPSHPLDTGIQSENGSGSAVGPTANTFEHIVIDGTAAGGLTRAGFYFALGAGGDNNNDLARFVKCQVRNHSAVGYLIMHSQSKSHTFDTCDATAASGVTNGIGISFGKDVKAGTTNGSGSGIIRGGSLNNHLDTDIWMGTPNDRIIIDGVQSENSARLLYVTGLTSGTMPIEVRGVRWAHAGSLAADGYCIYCAYPGPVLVEGCDFQDYGSGNPLKFFISGVTSTPGSLSVRDTRIETTVTDPATLVGLGGNAATQHVSLEGVLLININTDVRTRLGRVPGPLHVQSVAYASSITPNPRAGRVIKVGALTGNITINAVANPMEGDEMTIVLTQDGTGGRTITWNAAYLNTPTTNSGANAVTKGRFVYVGGNWIGG